MDKPPSASFFIYSPAIAKNKFQIQTRGGTIALKKSGALRRRARNAG
jgi:hypothetical protein